MIGLARERWEWCRHRNDCLTCQVAPALCPRGAQLARLVIEGMTYDESLQCDLGHGPRATPGGS